MFVNKLTMATFAVMASQPHEAIADVHDLGIQVELVKSLVGSMKHVLPNASNFSFISKENIILPQGQLKGFQVVFDFKLPQQSMVGKCVFYADKQFLYMLLATSKEGYFRAENEVFFNPAITSFSLVV